MRRSHDFSAKITIKDLVIYRTIALISTVTFPMFAYLYNNIYESEGYASIFVVILPLIYFALAVMTFVPKVKSVIYPMSVVIIYMTTFFFIYILSHHNYPINMALITTIAMSTVAIIFKSKMELKAYILSISVVNVTVFIINGTFSSNSFISILTLLVWPAIVFYMLEAQLNMKEAVQVQTRFLEVVFNSSNDPTIIVDRETLKVTICSESCLELIKSSNTQQVIGSDFIELQHKHLGNKIKHSLLSACDRSREITETIELTRCEQLRSYRLNISLFDVTGYEYYLLTLRDVTDEIQKATEILELAYTDELTQIGNRRKGMEDLDTYLNSDKHVSFSIFFIDVDRFKSINDSYGHDYGDKLLKAICKRIKSSLDMRDLIYRIGGDEFMVLLYGINDLTRLNRVAERVMSVFNEPFSFDGLQINVTISAGIARYPFDGKTKTTLLKNADLALYASKNAGKNCFNFYADGQENSNAIEKQ